MKKSRKKRSEMFSKQQERERQQTNSIVRQRKRGVPYQSTHLIRRNGEQQ